MDSWGELKQLLPIQLRRLPADLTAVVSLTVCTVLVVFVPWVNETPLRIVLGLPFVLFLPGYAFIAALFPEAGESPTDETAADETDQTADGSNNEERSIIDSETGNNEQITPSETDRSGIDGIERVALSFGLSIAIVPLLGLILNFTPWGIRLVPIVITVAGFTLISTAVAARRRWALPAADRFSVPYQTWITAGRSELFEPETRVDGALNVLLVLSIVLAIGSVGYAVAVPPEGEQFTEFYLLTETDDGEFVADEYPTTFVRGDTASVIVGIGNQEQAVVNYSVIVELQEVQPVDGGSVNVTNETANASTELEVVNRQQLDQFAATVEHNETWQESRELRPMLTGENLRVQYLLYRGEPPAEPTTENAYRSLHLWVDVFETEAALTRNTTEEQ